MNARLAIRGGSVSRALTVAFALVVISAIVPVTVDRARAAGPVATHERVVLVVGPAGAATAGYRRLADEAAAEARAVTDDVVTIYSPDATWDAVRPALQGASIVVYLGHGNGWPSVYSDSLYPASQDGLGLNPIAGGGDRAHQYFGETFLRRSVRLAPGAVVVLSHLCYASGNSEPGKAEGSLDTATQRVDNYAAGWLAAGAEAVVAEGHLGPAYYVRQLLRGKTAAAAWSSSPSFHDHLVVGPSVRTPGATLRLDPDHPTSGFYRSLVSGPGRSTPVSPVEPAAVEPSLAGEGVQFGTPAIDGTPVAGTGLKLRLPVVVPAGRRLAKGLRLGIRWDPLLLDPAAPDFGADALDGTGGAPASTEAPVDPVAPPPIELVVAEAPGDVVEPIATTFSRGSLRAATSAPTRPGTYRLVLTIHWADGRAVDDATNETLVALIVDVSSPLSAAFGVETSVRAPAETTLELAVRVANTGTIAWESPAAGVEEDRGNRKPETQLVATWIRVGSGPLEAGATAPIDVSVVDPSAAVAATLPPPSMSPAVVAPGTEQIIRLGLLLPSEAGSYLLVLDLDTPRFGSLAMNGTPPAIVRVHVDPAPQIAPVGTPF